MEPSTKCEYAAISKFERFSWGECHNAIHTSKNCLQSLDLVRTESILTVFEWPKSIKAFSSYVSEKQTRKKIFTGRN